MIFFAKMQGGRAKKMKKKEPLSELQFALLENNSLLQEAIVKAISKEIENSFKNQEMLQEERFKKLDYLIRQQQLYRKENGRKVNFIEKYFKPVLY